MGGELVSLQQVAQLSKRLNAVQSELNTLDAYCDGTQASAFLSPEVRRMVGNRLAELIINWPYHVLDSLENRLDVEGFRLDGSDNADGDLWRTWQANNMDVESQTAHFEAMLYGREFAAVWPEGNTGNDPVISIETPKQMIVDYAPGTRRVRAALKQWADGPTLNVSLFLPDRVEVYQGQARQQVTGSDGTSAAAIPYNIGSVVKLVDVLPNKLGVVPVAPLVNRRRTSRLDGQSELAGIIPLADAVNKLATDMMVTSEFYAEPRRWATGIQLPAKGGEGADTVARIQAEVRAYWDALEKGRTRVGGTGVQFGQDTPADLSSMVTAIEMLVRFLGALGVLPPQFLGIASTNPASADAIRASEAQSVKRAERKQRPFGGSWETVQCYAQAIKEGVKVADLDPKYLRMETVWASAQTRTISQDGDFAQKMVDAQIMAVPTVQEWIGMSPQQRARDAMFRQGADPMVATLERLALAHQLIRTGLDKDTALAQAGLTAEIAAANGFDPAAALTPSGTGSDL